MSSNSKFLLTTTGRMYLFVFSFLLLLAKTVKAEELPPHWSKNGVCVKTEDDQNGRTKETLLDPDECNSGNPLFIYDGEQCFKLGLKSNAKDVISDPQSINTFDYDPYELKPAKNLFNCSSDDAFYWNIGDTFCVKVTGGDSYSKQRKVDVDRNECAGAYQFFNGGCVAKPKTEDFWKGSGNASVVHLSDPTPCERSIYRRFGKACFYIQGFRAIPDLKDLLLHHGGYKFKYHRVGSEYCKKEDSQ